MIWQEDGMTYAQIFGSRLTRGAGASTSAALDSLSDSISRLLDLAYSRTTNRPALHPAFRDELKELKTWSEKLGIL
jgi:hypothetical protein